MCVEGDYYLDTSFLAQGCSCGGDRGACAGGAEHAGGSGATEWGLGDSL